MSTFLVAVLGVQAGRDTVSARSGSTLNAGRGGGDRAHWLPGGHDPEVKRCSKGEQGSGAPGEATGLGTDPKASSAEACSSSAPQFHRPHWEPGLCGPCTRKAPLLCCVCRCQPGRDSWPSPILTSPPPSLPSLITRRLPPCCLPESSTQPPAPHPQPPVFVSLSSELSLSPQALPLEKASDAGCRLASACPGRVGSGVLPPTGLAAARGEAGGLGPPSSCGCQGPGGASLSGLTFHTQERPQQASSSLPSSGPVAGLSHAQFRAGGAGWPQSGPSAS